MALGFGVEYMNVCCAFVSTYSRLMPRRESGGLSKDAGNGDNSIYYMS